MSVQKRTAALMTGVAMILSLAACGGDTSWAARSGESTMPAGVYILSGIDAYYDAQDALTEAGTTFDSTLSAEEVKKQILNSQVEGQPAADFIAGKTREYVHAYFAAEKLAAQQGIVISESDEAALQNNCNMVWQYSGNFYSQNGVSKDSILLMTRNYLLKNELFATLYGEGGERAVSEQEYQAYYTESRIRVRYLPLAISSGMTDEEKAALQEKANGYLQRAQSGEALSDLINEYQNELYDEAEKAAGENASSSSASSEPAERSEVAEGEYDLILTRDSTSPSKALTDEMFGAPEGEVRLVSDERAYYIAMRVDPMFSAEDYESLKPTLLEEMHGDEFQNWLIEKGSAMDITYNEDALKRFTPQKLNFKSVGD